MTRRLLLATALLVVAVPQASATHQAFPGKAGKLVFQSNRDGNYELYTANANGSGVKKLLSRPQTDEFNANWSPSGRRIVFQTGPKDGTNFDIWLVERDGTGAHAIVVGKTNDRAPQFCDFDTVVFTRQLSPTNSDVYSIELSTRRLKRLTTHPATDSFPTCNPQGTRVAFISSRDGPPRIYEMTRTGGGLRAIADGVDPDYSADGKAIAYVAPDADRNLEVFAKSLATGNVVQRTNVKPPFEYRLPKFVPEASSSRASASPVDADDKLVATQRDTSTTPAKEAVYELVSGGTRPVEDPASGGSAQPNPAGQCRCLKVDALIDNAIKTGDPNGDLSINLQLSWTITCTKGTGGCSGRVELAQARKFRVLGGASALDCSSRCARSNTYTTKELELTSGNPGAADGGVVVRIRFVCEGKRTEQLYKLVFQSNGRFLDREQSDLDGNRVPDGKEK